MVPWLAFPSWQIQLSRHRAALGYLKRLHPQWDSKSLKGVHAGSKMGDCEESVWGDPADLGDTQGEGKGRLLCACATMREAILTQEG